MTAKRLRSSSVEADPFALELVLKDPILFLYVGDHVVLLPIDPAGQSHQQELPRVENVHGHDSTRPEP